MDAPLMLLAAVSASVGAALAIAALRQPHRRTAAEGPDSILAASTEGMKVCHRCTMGNMWTARSCSACGTPLRG